MMAGVMPSNADDVSYIEDIEGVCECIGSCLERHWVKYGHFKREAICNWSILENLPPSIRLPSDSSMAPERGWPCSDLVTR